MTNLVPFSENVPANIAQRKRMLDVNKDVVTVAAFPSLSIKGKVFALVQDSERKVLTKPDDPDEIVQSINVAFLRINQSTKTYYKKAFSEDDDAQRPDCYSNDGLRPSPNAQDPQSESCKACKWNIFGSRVSPDGKGKGKACTDHARIAVVDPRSLDKPLLLRVPPASLKPLREDALRKVKSRGFQYNEVVFKIGFDQEASAPKLTFKPVGFLDDKAYEKACELYDSDIVRAIVGLDESAEAAPTAHKEEAGEADEFDAAIKARDVVAKAAAPEAPALPVGKPEKAKPGRKPKAEVEKPAAPAAPSQEEDDLLGDLSRLLDNKDD